MPRHEVFAAEFIHRGHVAQVLRQTWGIEPEEVTSLLRGTALGDSANILGSLLSGPIDIDKMDYLSRDSLHAGVPYGRNFDQTRLIGSLCLNAPGDALAISDKGRTAAEMMVFARYVMFSEVYWHHTVRAATAMLQRAFYVLQDQLDFDSLFLAHQQPMVDTLFAASLDTTAQPLLEGLFGPRRVLYKRLEQYSLVSASTAVRSPGSSALRMAGAVQRAARKAIEPSDRSNCSPGRGAAGRTAAKT